MIKIEAACFCLNALNRKPELNICFAAEVLRRNEDAMKYHCL